MARRRKPFGPTASPPRLEVPTTPIDPAKLPHGVSEDEAERMVADLLASGEVAWLEAPDLFELPTYIQYLVDQATAPSAAEHIQEVRNARAERRRPAKSAIAMMASNLGSTKINYLPVERTAWAAHLELKRYSDCCQAQQREMYIAARTYFKAKQQPDPIPGRPDEWGALSDALRYAAFLKLGYTPKEAGKMLARHVARIKTLAAMIPESDVDLQIRMANHSSLKRNG